MIHDNKTIVVKWYKKRRETEWNHAYNSIKNTLYDFDYN